jgi:hypothetical protein
VWLSIVREAFAESDSLTDVRSMLEKRARHTGLAGAFAAGLHELVSYVDSPLGEADTAVQAEAQAVEASRRIVRPVLEAKLQARLDQLDRESRGKTRCTGCARVCQSKGRPSRGWQSLLGAVGLKRRYSYCDDCEQGHFAGQQAVGLTDSGFTPRLEEVCTMIAATVPYGMAVQIIGSLCGVQLSTKGIEQMVERRGEAVSMLDDEQAQACNPYDETGLPVQQARPEDTVDPSAAPDVAYVELDGVIPITREELGDEDLTDADRQRQAQAKQNKARGGKGRRFRIVGREVKNAVLYDGKDCVRESAERGSILDKTYVSYLGSWPPFALLLWAAMVRLRFDQSRLLVVLSDGAEWIRSLGEWLPIPVILILDLYHVKHRIWEVAYAVWGEASQSGCDWAGVQCGRVEEGRVDDVLQALRFVHPDRDHAREKVDQLVTYLENNRDRMDYPDYRARGLRISSSGVESANFHVTGARLKLQGMRWSADGAARMAALRADLFNDQWEKRTRKVLAA